MKTKLIIFLLAAVFLLPALSFGAQLWTKPDGTALSAPNVDSSGNLIVKTSTNSSSITTSSSDTAKTTAFQGGTWEVKKATVTVDNFPSDYYKGQNITVAVSSGAVEISSGPVSILGAVNVNATITNQVSTQAVKDIYYQVTAPTYTIITAYTSGSTAITFDVDSYSALSLGGDNSFDINSIGTIPVNDGKTYTSPVKLKRYVNPTINYTVTTGTLTLVIEGYQP